MPAHLRRLTDSFYLAAGAGALIVAAAIQLGIYQWLLREPLQAADFERVRPAFKRWIGAALAWQAVVIVGTGVYVYLVTRSRPEGIAWVAPAIGLLLGTALPLQLVASTALRAGSRAPR
ncbi:MAG TPA: hypothetical protein VFB69_09530 [Candidatus Dormibacteraeota bacterium]|nr:hypothetical protein [Candidatus Dormibacteraeota bacterium]